MNNNLLKNGIYAIFAASIGNGLLFLMRGAFLPYFFPLYQKTTDLNYIQISILLNIFILIQAIFAPFIGLFLNRITNFQKFLFATILHILGFLTIIFNTHFFISIIGISFIGIAFTLSKITFGSIIIEKTKMEKIRKVISYKSLLLNIGSLSGVLLTLYISLNFNYTLVVILLCFFIFVIWAIPLTYKEEKIFR